MHLQFFHASTSRYILVNLACLSKVFLWVFSGEIYALQLTKSQTIKEIFKKHC